MDRVDDIHAPKVARCGNNQQLQGVFCRIPYNTYPARTSKAIVEFEEDIWYFRSWKPGFSLMTQDKIWRHVLA